MAKIETIVEPRTDKLTAGHGLELHDRPNSKGLLAIRTHFLSKNELLVSTPKSPGSEHSNMTPNTVDD